MVGCARIFLIIHMGCLHYFNLFKLVMFRLFLPNWQLAVDDITLVFSFIYGYYIVILFVISTNHDCILDTSQSSITLPIIIWYSPKNTIISMTSSTTTTHGHHYPPPLFWQVARWEMQIWPLGAVCPCEGSRVVFSRLWLRLVVL